MEYCFAFSTVFIDEHTDRQTGRDTYIDKKGDKDTM
jgi:hypothetical protein